MRQDLAVRGTITPPRPAATAVRAMARRLLGSLQIMKPAPKFRRSTGALPLLALAAATATAAAEMPDTKQLEEIVRAEAARQFPPLTAKQRFLVGPLAAGLEIPLCSQPIRPLLATPHHMQDRLVIELRCQEPKLWHTYVPVRIIGTSSVAVAAHAIVQGSVLKESDLRVEEHDLTELPPGFLDDPAIAVGLTASRPISQGAYLTNQQLLAAHAVQRGQSVTLVADAGGMSIRMAGRALSDGLMNQRVKVQNLSSGRIVEGVARSPQVVEIILQ
jgi:flagellar basal body P-ring formation protein FlgA